MGEQKRNMDLVCSLFRKFGGTPGLSGRGYSTYLTYKQGKRVYKRDVVNTHDTRYTSLPVADHITSDPSNSQIYYFSGNSINSSPVGSSGTTIYLNLLLVLTKFDKTLILRTYFSAIRICIFVAWQSLLVLDLIDHC